MNLSGNFCFFLLCLNFIYYSNSQITNSISDEEINSFVQQLLSADNNRARSNHLTVNYQQHSNSKIKTDVSREKLFSYVSPHLLRRPTYSKLNALFDNYYPNTGEKELQTNQENVEVDQFLQTVFNTTVFNKTYQFLHQKKTALPVKQEGNRARKIDYFGGFRRGFCNETRNKWTPENRLCSNFD